jgi:hypothetical protein
MGFDIYMHPVFHHTDQDIRLFQSLRRFFDTLPRLYHHQHTHTHARMHTRTCAHTTILTPVVLVSPVVNFIISESDFFGV